MEVVRVDQPSAHLAVAVDFYGPRVQALQLAYPDDRGHWPWHRGFRGHHRGGQPILGVRADVPTKTA
jgi:Domain of unknown function (DUF4262)